MYQENKELWIWSGNAMEERSVVLATATTYHFLKSIISMVEDVKSGGKIAKDYMTVYLMESEEYQTLKYYVGSVMQKTISFVKIISLEIDLLLFGSDVIVQRYVDYTGNTKVKRNGEELIWQKTKAEDQQ